MSADDPHYDPERWLINWEPDEPERTIVCDCGASVDLRHLFNACPNCNATWDKWGHRVFGSTHRAPKP